MSRRNSTTSESSLPADIMSVLEAPAPPKKGKGGKKVVPKKEKTPEVVPVAEVVAEVVPVAEVESEVVPERYESPVNITDPDTLAEDEVRDIAGQMGGWIPFLKWVKDTKEKATKSKNDNSPDIENGVHIRMLDGQKTKMKYIFPYKADGGKSLIKEMKEKQVCYGVSTKQKNNSKEVCKTAGYKMIWLNKNTVQDMNTGVVYAQHDGKFAVVDGMEAVNVRLMVLA